MDMNNSGRIETRRCKICDQPIIATCDRTKESKLMLFETGRAADPITTHTMYPTAEEQDDLCFRCRRKGALKVGKQSGPRTVPFDKMEGNKINAN